MIGYNVFFRNYFHYLYSACMWCVQCALNYTLHRMRNSDWIKSINRNDRVLLYFVVSVCLWKKSNGLPDLIDVDVKMYTHRTHTHIYMRLVKWDEAAQQLHVKNMFNGLKEIFEHILLRDFQFFFLS